MLLVDNFALKKRRETMSNYLSGHYANLSNKGKVRNNNEDYAASRINPYGNLLLVVADGMGGANKGEYASKKCVTTIENAFMSLEEEFKSERQVIKWLNEVINIANDEVYKKSISDKRYEKMGTTLSLVLLIKDKMYTAQIGDSRIYMVKDKKLVQVSVDQTYVQYLLNQKKLSLQQIATHPDRHKLTNALGLKKNVSIDINVYDYHNESILLCTDGVYNNVPLIDIESIMKGTESSERKCQQLILFGNANGGSDNMAVVVWESN